MLTPVTPIIIPAAEENPGSSDDCFKKRHAVIMISLFEILCSIGLATLYIYALAWEPEWAHFLVPIPKDLCNSKTIVTGVMYTIILLCSLELLLALYLLEGARRECLSKARFWITSMFTYMILVTVVILGLNLGSIRCPTMNSAAFINIFIRFLEILIVFSWTEQETMKRFRCRGTGSSRRHHLRPAVSSLTISTIASGVIQGTSTLSPISECEQTPPPSYSMTIPQGEQLPVTNSNPHQRQEPALTKEEDECERTEQWRKQWE